MSEQGKNYIDNLINEGKLVISSSHNYQQVYDAMVNIASTESGVSLLERGLTNAEGALTIVDYYNSLAVSTADSGIYNGDNIIAIDTWETQDLGYYIGEDKLLYRSTWERIIVHEFIHDIYKIKHPGEMQNAKHPDTYKSDTVIYLENEIMSEMGEENRLCYVGFGGSSYDRTGEDVSNKLPSYTGDFMHSDPDKSAHGVTVDKAQSLFPNIDNNMRIINQEPMLYFDEEGNLVEGSEDRIYTNLQEYLSERTFDDFVLIKENDYLVFPDNLSSEGVPSPSVKLFDWANAQLDLSDLSLLDNSILDLSIEDKSTSTSEDQSSEDHSDDWEDGIAKHGSNYDAWMDPNILNVDGYFNVDPSSIVTDGYRPGAQELSDFNLHDNIADTAGEMYDNFTDPLGGPDFRLFDFNNQQADAVNFINIDPLVIDLDGSVLFFDSYKLAA